MGHADNSVAAPSVDVVVLTHNDGDLLDAAVQSALDSIGVDTRVWVIDNGSDPPATVVHDQRVHLVRNEQNAGVGGGRNQGIRLGDAPFVCVLDSDARLGPKSLAQLVKPLADQLIGVTVPVFVGQHPSESAGSAPSIRVKVDRALGRRQNYEPTQRMGEGPSWDVDFGIGACQVFRRDVFDATGGIDESDPFGPEDVDFCLRVIGLGHRVVQVADTEVHHPPRRAHRRPFSRRGLRHAVAVARYFLKRQRRAGRSSRACRT